ncbi:hypothetical protein I3843_02G027800 [Carya illinoinensis]|uniref:uncharacterized protein LOC122301978 n=1 Tax=Carya illinoinensis TaxID=32201 RepID=UPI001BFB660E|nr:uncharacterized protein LOC122301978 [Carya illinoinensis]KAG2720460.1 hypothetical protein I3760_02G036200 [Carya illinoinensis]KAG7990494.1 hypothetical protein I3843_02G027800 [Carya illinoinensis]
MAEKKEQARPLAQATDRLSSGDEARPLAQATDRLSSGDGDVEATLRKQKTRRKRCMIKCCGCIVASVLILVAVILILIFTVFRVKDPTVKMNRISVTRLELINRMTLVFGVNMSLAADVSVKNPNVASFKYKNTTTTLFYRDMVVGEVQTPPGKAKARRTMHLNVTADIVVDRLMSQSNVPDLLADVRSGLLTVGTYSIIPGRVKMLSIISKHVVLRLNCTVTVNISSLTIQDLDCKRKVSL